MEVRSMNRTPEISVIIPVYKVENYLSQCVESILAQSFTNFELLLIDDGSPDNSGILCDEWGMRDNRIRVFHQENSGVSAARNRGLCEACGKYIVFVDSDDWILPGYLEHLYAYAGRGLVVQGYVRCTEDNVITEDIYLPEYSKYRQTEFRDFFRKKDIGLLSSPWSKIYDLKLIREHALFFDERVSFGEDTLFVYYYILHCEYLVTVRYSEYIYRETTGSLSSKIHSFISEYVFFRKQYAFVREMACRFHLSSEDMGKLFKSSLLFFQRALRTDYLRCHKVPRSIRIEHLKQLVRENEEFIRAFYQPDYKLDKLGRFMLRNHLYGLYDFCFRLLFRLHVKQIFLGNLRYQ